MPQPDQAFRPLRVTAVLDALAGTHFARLRYAQSTASTNANAAGVMGSPSARGLTTFAEFQTDGVGRKQRRWVAPAGSSLLFTTILPEPLAASALWALPFWTALAVVEGIEIATGLRADLKWPNDVLIGERKLCGILCTSRVKGDQAWVGCGIGLNVLRPAHDAGLEEIVPPPIFLNERVPDVEREDVLIAILARFESSLAALHAPEQIARRWEARAGLAGRTYRVRLDGSEEDVTGTALRLGPHGELVVRAADGREIEVTAGDAHVVRDPALSA